MTLNMTTEQAIAACLRHTRRFEVRCFNEKFLTYKVFDMNSRNWVIGTEGIDLVEVEKEALRLNIDHSLIQ